VSTGSVLAACDEHGDDMARREMPVHSTERAFITAPESLAWAVDLSLGAGELHRTVGRFYSPYPAEDNRSALPGHQAPIEAFVA
jgi:hypothetical protein